MTNDHALAYRETLDALSALHDRAGQFVTQADRRRRLPRDFQNIRSAQPAAVDAYQQLSGSAYRQRHILQADIIAGVIDQGLHNFVVTNLRIFLPFR